MLKSVIQSLFTGRTPSSIHGPGESHRWEPIRRGFPQMICRCGSMHAPGGIKAGKNTIDVGAAGAGDIIRFGSAIAPIQAGDLSMTGGRPFAFIDGAARDIQDRDEGIDGSLRRGFMIQQDANLTTLSQVGFATAPTVNSPGGTSVTNVTGSGQYISYTTGAVANNDAGLIAAAFTQSQLGFTPIFDCIMRTGGTITNLRFWIGLFSATPMASATPAVHMMAFRYDTVADGTAFLRTVTDNGSGVPTVTTTTTPVVASLPYRLRIATNAAFTSVFFIVTDSIVATHTTTLPTSGQALGHVEQVRTLDAVTKTFSFSKLALTQRVA